MPQPRRVKSTPFVQAVEFLIRDESADVERAYRPQVMTRTRKRETQAALADLVDLERTIADQDGPRTEKQEEKAVKMACDLIDLMVRSAKDDGTPAGEILFRDWLAELTPESYIADRLDSIMSDEGEPNPT